MKKLLAFMFMGLVLFSCSKDDSPSTNNTTAEPLATAPVAKAENDASSTGVYKGVFVGSTGILSVYVKNGDDKITAVLRVDGKNIAFTAPTAGIVKDQPIVGLTFTSSEGHSFKLNVLADGSDYSIAEIAIAGHPNASIDLIKEKSNQLVRCYEGTYASNKDATNKGTFNMILSGNLLKGLAKSGEGVTYLKGEASDKNVAGTSGGDKGYFSGAISGDNISGTFSNADQTDTGTWSGKRTL